HPQAFSWHHFGTPHLTCLSVYQIRFSLQNYPGKSYGKGKKLCKRSQNTERQKTKDKKNKVKNKE
ncbi:MAG: hypothetical protein U9Q98_08855, partial [Bacteroidota bacterium]|nr:hypothetical protein [Bacteroidota bacterium]